MNRSISLLGSTGSIGTQTLDVVDRQSDKFDVCGLAANRNVKLLSEQIRKYKPLKAAIFDETLYNNLLKDELHTPVQNPNLQT